MKKSKNNYTFYNVVTKLIRFLGNIVFGGTAIGIENIPDGKCLLAGNHVGNFDAYLLFLKIKRPIHIIGKIELFKGTFSFIFKKMHIIPVDRKNKNPEAKEQVLNLLKEEKIVAIFPEGTYHKETLLLPFKPGVINFAEKSKAPVVPFAIIGNYKWRSHPKIVFGKPLDISKIEGDKVAYLEKQVETLILENKKF